MTEIKKVVIPQFVAEWLTEANLSLRSIYWLLEHGEITNRNVESWISENEKLFIHSYVNGYEIEKEKLYYVQLPEKNAFLNARVLKKHPNGEIGFGLVDKLDLKTAIQIRLTEQEIKSIDERYWAFAVEVEGEE